MEKYLRLLNPKTTNFDAIGGGSHGSITAQDVCVAISYAKLTPLQDNLVRMKCLGANSIENIEEFATVLLGKYDTRLMNAGLANRYHLVVIRVALIEFCKVPANYKPTERNREVLSGFSDSTVRKHLAKHIDAILEDFQDEYELSEEKIFFQLNKTN